MKLFDPSRDIKEQISQINEVNIYNGSIFSGATINSLGSANIKRYNHWTSGSKSGSYYHGLYSTHITASTTIELIDIAYGFSISSSFYTDPAVTNKTEKNKIYRLFAKKLLGSEDSRFSMDGTTRDSLVFLSLKRSQTKDELKKGSISLTTILSGAGGSATEVSVKSENVFSDDGAATSYFEDEIAGDYAYFKSGSIVGGLLYYNAGILVLAPEVISNTGTVPSAGNKWSGSLDFKQMVVSGGGGTLDNTLDAIRYRLRNLSIINQSNLHSSFYFCRALNDEFNYSSNPTFLDADKRIIPTSGSNNLITRTYITKVGLTDDNGDLLAVASVSQPIKKAPDSEIVIKVRIDL